MNTNNKFSKHQSKLVKEIHDAFLDKVERYIFKGLSKRLPTIAPQDLDKKITSNIDHKLHAFIGKFLLFSPASMATTFFDWYVHLAISPGKQWELAENAFNKAVMLYNYLLCVYVDQADHCVVPMSQDPRFAHKSWLKWPYNLYQQSFLLTEQWWVEATRDVRGVTQHHSELLPFLVRQWMDIWSPSNFPFTNPLIIQETLNHKGKNFKDGITNFMEDITRMINQEPPVGTEQFKVGENIAITPGKVVYQNDLIELIQYLPTTTKVYSEPLLIVPAWIMKYYILDLSPHNSLVKYLVDQGHTVFMISWKNPTENDREMSFEDYLYLGVISALDTIATIFPEKRIHAAGYCLGGTLLAIAAAKLAQSQDFRLKSLTLLAAQIDFEEAGELQFFIDESQLAFLEDLMWEKGYLDATRMANTFYMLRSNDLIWSRMIESYMLGKRQEVSDLMAWNADATRMPYKMHSEYLRSLYLNNDLANNRFKVKGEIVSLSNITIPIFTISTTKDHIAPWESVYKIHNLVDTEITFILTSGGHNAGIISEPGHKERHYQISTHNRDDIHLPHEEWQKVTPELEGSWWLSWHKWLALMSSEKVLAENVGMCNKHPVLRDAPGEYVLHK